MSLDQALKELEIQAPGKVTYFSGKNFRCKQAGLDRHGKRRYPFGNAKRTWRCPSARFFLNAKKLIIRRKGVLYRFPPLIHALQCCWRNLLRIRRVITFDSRQISAGIVTILSKEISDLPRGYHHSIRNRSRSAIYRAIHQTPANSGTAVNPCVATRRARFSPKKNPVSSAASCTFLNE
ncbi:MAG: hypothetical protein K0R57_4587 [Paenibacillaceae bacterium]|nr:hypothetical protein [Paenibacillaceae bacterium]